jgi:hypothetical protein
LWRQPWLQLRTIVPRPQHLQVQAQVQARKRLTEQKYFNGHLKGSFLAAFFVILFSSNI